MMRILSAVSACVTGLSILMVYVWLRVVPFSEITLSDDQIGDAIAGNILYVLGLVAILSAVRLVGSKTGTVVLILLGVALILGVTVFAFIFQAGSFRGAEWAFETLLIRLLPFVFFLLGGLIIIGARKLSLLLGVVFGCTALVHWFLAVKIGIDVMADRAFSTANWTQVTILVTIAVIGSVFALVNFTAFRKHQPERTFIHRFGRALVSKTGLIVMGILVVAICIVAGIFVVLKAKSQNAADFLDAARQGDLDVLRRMIESGMDVDATDEYGNTALIEFSRADKDNPEVIGFLIDSGADIDARTETNRTPLILQASQYQVQNVEALLEAGADPDIQTEYGVTALIETIKYPPPKQDEARMRLIGVVQALLAADADTTLVDEYGMNVAHHAAEHGLDEVIPLLAQKEMDLDAFGQNDQSPLMVAIQNNRLEVVSELIKAGADVNLADDDGWSPLVLAVQQGRQAIFDALIEAGVDVDPSDEHAKPVMLAAAQNGQEAIFNVLLDKGAPVQVQDDWGETPLMAAAEAGHVKLVDLLVKAGADVDDQDETGTTALHEAVSRNHLEVIDILLKSGADPNLLDQWKRNALNVAAEEGTADAARLLLDAGARVGVKNRYDKTPLDAATERGDQALIDLLTGR